jgi:antitoxin (DNA-binding transcriptional repressor) of toxin-antitoxin stability system
VNIAASRMWTVTDAKPKLNSLVAEAQSGQITHIVSGAQVVAHLVPSTTWIVDDPLALEFMLRAVIVREAAWAAADKSQLPPR